MGPPRERTRVEARHVRRELLPSQSPELLQTLHLLTRDGALNADARRKLKQVNHLVGLLQPALDDVLARYPSPVAVDAGSGNAYLGFVLAELFFKGPSARGELIGVESRGELVEKARERARALGLSALRFVQGRIGEAVLPERVHLVTALHACDTATDEALVAAVRARADHLALVPCCQAELAEQLRTRRSAMAPALAPLVQHPWHRREFGSHLTNVIRALVLESLGYQVTVTELTGWEHSLKNELILARRVHRESSAARAKLRAVLDATGVWPAAVRLLAGPLGLDASVPEPSHVPGAPGELTGVPGHVTAARENPDAPAGSGASTEPTVGTGAMQGPPAVEPA